MNANQFVEAARRIAPYVRRTPTFSVTYEGQPLTFKLEQLQVGGSFKYRGATNTLLQLSAGTKRVVAASGGNHGIAVAIAARRLQIPAIVVVPETTPADKIARLEQIGIDLVLYGRHYSEAEAHARSMLETNDRFIHPFADEDVIAGQGTVGLELLDQVPADCDAVVAAVGGGGLVSGLAGALQGSSLAVFGAEPEGIPTMFRALREGIPVDVSVNSVTSSSLGAQRTTAINLAMVKAHTESVALVSDAEVLAAQRILWEEFRLAVEPGAATGLAAVLNGHIGAKHPCIVLCGANGDLPKAA